MNDKKIEDSKFGCDLELEYVMARIRAMKDAKRRLEEEIKEDMKYVKEAMTDETEMKCGSFKATVVTRTRKGVMSLSKVTELLGEEVAEKITTRSVSEWIQIDETFDNVKMFEIGPDDLVPDWAQSAYRGLTNTEEE